MVDALDDPSGRWVDLSRLSFEGEPEPWPPSGQPISGSPAARDFPLSVGAVETGIWECSPGAWATEVRGYSELMHFISGKATITTAQGEVISAHAGVVLFVSEGWTATWHVEETIRKSYCIVRSAIA